MTKKNINFMHNTKNYWGVLIRITFYQLMDQKRPKTGNPLSIFLFLSILLLSYLTNVSNKTYHDTGENKLAAECIGGLVSITLCLLVYQLRPKMNTP